jgi:NAD(P)-dependent dehydrogenase (short-subunit alcohol dehydrogenase family)
VRLSGLKALVTGAERGIGRALAIGLARQGADVAILYYQSHEQAEEVASCIKGLGRRVLTVQADISQPEQVETAIDSVYAGFGSLDILVNNGGVVFRQPFLEIPLSDFKRTLDVNLVGTFLVTQRIAQRMVDSGTKGRIVMIASVSATRTATGLVHYQASKAAIVQFARGVARELAPHGIRVNAVCPGLTLTDFNKDVMADPELAARRVAAIPLGVAGEPEDHVGAVVYLVSDEANWVTGSVVTVDGGITL